MSCTCGCCRGVTARTPASITTPLGLSALVRRVGTYGDFFETMLAALSGTQFPALESLHTRLPGDPTIAFIDAAATMLDVLTFYQERLANEGYLRTATERRSILELGRLVGYRPRPGVAASAWVAYTLEEGHRVVIPKGSKVQSSPGPDELPQTFETSGDLEARAEWNNLKPRLTRPQTKGTILRPDPKKGYPLPRVFLEGTSTRLSVGDPVLMDFGGRDLALYRVAAVVHDREARWTLISMSAWRADSFQERIKFALLTVGDPKRFNVAIGETATRILKSLSQISDMLSANVSDGSVAKVVREDIAPALALELAAASSRNNARIVDWLSSLLPEVSRISSDVAPTGPESRRAGVAIEGGITSGSGGLPEIIDQLIKPASVTPRRLARTLALIAKRSEFSLSVLSGLRPHLREMLPIAVANATTNNRSVINAFALRLRCGLFGSALQGTPTYETTDEGLVRVTGYVRYDLNAVLPRSGSNPMSDGVKEIALDAVYDRIIDGSWVAMDRPAFQISFEPAVFLPRGVTFHRVLSVRVQAMKADAFNSRCTILELDPPWFSEFTSSERRHALSNVDVLDGTLVLAQSERLDLADELIDEDVCNDGILPIELNSVVPELATGRILLITGERADIPGTSGVRAAERAMIAGVEHRPAKSPKGFSAAAWDSENPDLPGDRNHTFIWLSNGLKYCYKRDTVTIYGNVVDATHGETRNETLGGGDASQPFQTFDLKAKPLTFVAALNPEGAESSLTVRVNDLRWRQGDTLADLEPMDRVYITQTDDEATTSVTFGDGLNGARPATGLENLTAVYRNGIGKVGNVKAGQLNLLGSKPLGVKEVINPLRASGGADADTRDRARRLVPASVQALDRLISVSDYADFARSFAGIGKAISTRVSNRHSEVIHVTVAGVDDVPILESSDLYGNLSTALIQLGDPFLPVELTVRDLILLVVSARVRIGPDYLWEAVEKKIRAALLDAFGFERRELGQAATAGEVLAVIQAVEGVLFADLEAFGPIREWESNGKSPPSRQLISPATIAANIEELARAGSAVTGACPWPGRFCPVRAAAAHWDEKLKRILPAELAILSPDVQDTLILNPI
jgi:hypothetical protein